MLIVPGGAKVRVHYATDFGERRIKPLVFPVLTAEERVHYVPQEVARYEDTPMIGEGVGRRRQSEVTYL